MGFSNSIVLLLVGLLALFHVNETIAFQFGLKNANSQVSSTAASIEIIVTPPQPELKEIKVDKLVDTNGNELLSNTVIPLKKSVYDLSLSSNHLKLPPGLYKMKVSASSVSDVLSFKVTTQAKIKSASLNGLTLNYGETFQSQEFSSGSGDALQVEVEVVNPKDNTPLKAHQVFLRFVHVQENVNTFFVLHRNNEQVYTTLINFGLLSQRFQYKSGQYKLELIVGDATFEKSLLWELGSVELLLGAAPPKTHFPLYKKPLLHESDTTLVALPEIKHIMRPQDPRPPVLVSMAFTAGALAPLCFFLLFILKLGVNFSKLFHRSIFIFGVGFLTSFAAILGLFALYWLELTMYTTLRYLVIIGGSNLIFGHLTLKRLANDDTDCAESAKTKSD